MISLGSGPELNSSPLEAKNPDVFHGSGNNLSIPYIENTKDATRKLLELNEFCKVARCKINTQKSLAFLYTKK